MKRWIALLALVALAGCGGAVEAQAAPDESTEVAPVECGWETPEACPPCPGDAEPEGCFELATIWRGQVLGFCAKHFACDAPLVPVTKIYPDE